MLVSSYSPKVLDNSNMKFSAYILFIVFCVLLLLFIVLSFIIIPLSCYFNPTNQQSNPTELGFGITSCSFNWFNSSSSANKCTGTPPFPTIFVLGVVLLVFGSFMINAYAKPMI